MNNQNQPASGGVATAVRTAAELETLGYIRHDREHSCSPQFFSPYMPARVSGCCWECGRAMVASDDLNAYFCQAKL